MKPRIIRPIFSHFFSNLLVNYNKLEMKYFVTYFLFFTMIVLASCNSKKEVVNLKDASKQIEQNLINQGYIIGTVMHVKNSLCEYIIIDKNTGSKFDPINIDNEHFKTFKINEKVIYYKYRPLRRVNRCKDIQPIEIEDIRSK